MVDMNNPNAVGQGLRVLQRVVFPADDLDVVPLYVETNIDRGAAELAAETQALALTGRRALTGALQVASAVVGEAESSIRFGADVPAHLVEDAGPRRSAVISPGRRVSFATYFNAFPASYWRRWTTVSSVARAAADPVHRRRLVLVRHRGRSARDDADRGGLAGSGGAGPGWPAQHRHHHVQQA